MNVSTPVAPSPYIETLGFAGKALSASVRFIDEAGPRTGLPDPLKLSDARAAAEDGVAALATMPVIGFSKPPGYVAASEGIRALDQTLSALPSAKPGAVDVTWQGVDAARTALQAASVEIQSAIDA